MIYKFQIINYGKMYTEFIVFNRWLSHYVELIDSEKKKARIHHLALTGAFALYGREQ